MGCYVRILACVDRKVDQLVITDICLDHNHEVSSDLCKQYPEVRLFSVFIHLYLVTGHFLYGIVGNVKSKFILSVGGLC